jgi:hypothetical protein
VAHRRRAHRAAAAGLTAAGLTAAALLLAAACGKGESPASPEGTFTIEEALRADVDGPIRVRGTVIADARGVRLCSAILESHPPQCGKPSLVVRGLDLVGVSNMEQAKGVGWTSREVTIEGEVDDGVLTVSTS